MSTTSIKRKLDSLQAELDRLRRTVEIAPSAKVDELNWQKVRKTAKSARKRLFQQTYKNGKI